MTWSPSSPVTGAAQTGFTSPTYTLTLDVAPDVNGKQYAVTAIGGTQTGVRTHAVSDPFTITFVRPKVPKTLGTANPVTGKYASIPRNTYAQITRKGVLPAANLSAETAICRSYYDIPAGADSYDPSNVRALVSAHNGAAWQQASGIGDTLVSGIM